MCQDTVPFFLILFTELTLADIHLYMRNRFNETIEERKKMQIKPIPYKRTVNVPNEES